MATSTEPLPVDTDTGDGEDGLSHCYCECDEDIALCGTDVSGHAFDDAIDSEDLLCVVCVELEFKTCSRCGSCV